MPWRRVGPLHVTAAEAIARGKSLLAAAAPDDSATLAWWVVGNDSLVLGRGSRVNADADACGRAGVPVIRRRSGGGPVLWGPDLLGLDVLVPRRHAWSSGDVVEAYRIAGEAVAAGLTALDVPARALTPDEARALNDPEVTHLACFAGRSPWEVVVGDRKAGGLSQVRRRNATLLQVGIRLCDDDGRLARLLEVDEPARLRIVDALRPSPGGAGRALEASDVIAAVETAFAGT